MPYLEWPKMYWTVNDSLYHRFLKWKLKCENILDCEVAMLPESKKCKKVIAWSGDFWMDQYMSWWLPADLSLDTIWAKYEDFCKPQTIEVRARFDLLPKLQTRYLFCGWVVQCCTTPSVSSQVPIRNCKYLALRYFLVFPQRWRICFWDHQW